MRKIESDMTMNMKNNDLKCKFDLFGFYLKNTEFTNSL